MPYAGEIYNAKGYSTETQGAFNHKLNSQLTSQAMRGHKLGIPNLYQDSGRDTVETLSASGLLAHRLEKGPLIFRGGPLIRTSIKETSLLGNVLFVLTAVPVLEPHCTSAESCGGYPMENTSKCTLPWGEGPEETLIWLCSHVFIPIDHTMHQKLDLSVPTHLAIDTLQSQEMAVIDHGEVNNASNLTTKVAHSHTATAASG